MDEPIHLAGATLGVHRHVCAFFPDLDEEYSVLVPFIVEGLTRGEKAFHAIGPKMRGEHLDRLRRGGIDVSHAERTGQLEVRSWDEVQLAEGGFDLKRMGDFIEELLAKARSEGYPGTRFITHMEWVLENRPGVEDFLEFEGRLGRMLMRFPDPVICIYDPNSWGGRIVIDVVRTHPMNIVDGVLQEQPFFTYADDLIRELRQRDAEAKRSSKTVRQREIDSIPPRLLRSGIRDLVGVLLVRPLGARTRRRRFITTCWR